MTECISYDNQGFRLDNGHYEGDNKDSEKFFENSFNFHYILLIVIDLKSTK